MVAKTGNVLYVGPWPEREFTTAPQRPNTAARLRLIGGLVASPIVVVVFALYAAQGPAPPQVQTVPDLQEQSAWGMAPFSAFTRQAAVRPAAPQPGEAALGEAVMSDAPAARQRDQPVAERSPESVAPATPSVLLNVEKTALGWHIDALGASRLAIAEQLAQLSGSTLAGDRAPLAAMRPQALRWHGRDLEQAWKAVLDGELSYALQCGPERCTVWLAGSPAAAFKPPAP